MTCIELCMCVCVCVSFFAHEVVSPFIICMLSTQTEALSNINKCGPCNTEITQTTASMSIITADAISPYRTEWMNLSSSSHTCIVSALLCASATGAYLSPNILTETKMMFIKLEISSRGLQYIWWAPPSRDLDLSEMQVYGYWVFEKLPTVNCSPAGSDLDVENVTWAWLPLYHPVQQPVWQARTMFLLSHKLTQTPQRFQLWKPADETTI